MRKTLTEIAQIVEGEIVGDGDLVVTGLCGIKEGKVGDLTFLSDPKYISLAGKTKASAILTSRNISVRGKSIIRTDDPAKAFAKVVSLLADKNRHFQGIHKTATIAKGVSLGKNVAIGPYVVIDGNAAIGDHCIIYSGTFIGHDTTIGNHCLVYPNVSIREKVIIGDHVIIHGGAVIGSDGFGFTSVNGVHEKIQQLGNVVIEDHVEIGANVTIDRARFGKTLIENGTKIDNLVHVGHNVHIEENCIILAQVGISGSVHIGKNVILTGQVGVTGHLTIGDGAIVTSQSAVTKSVLPRTTVSGSPAKPQMTAQKVNACLQLLPKYVATIRELNQRTRDLETQLNY